MNLKILTMMVVSLALLACAALASAADKKLTVAWDYDPAKITADKIVGFRVKNAAGISIMDKLAPTTRTATATVAMPDGCQSFYITAYTADRETGPSNIITWCPPVTALTGVGKFSVEVNNP